MESTMLLIAAVAFLLNVPLGMWRETQPRFSVGWFVALHLSVPVIIALRVLAGLPLASAPVPLALAVLGQIVGSRGLRHVRARSPRLTD